MNLASRLTQLLPPQQFHLIQLIADEASRRGLTLYAVGGLPRDLLLRRLTRDLDLVVEGDAIPLARALSRLHGGRVTTHPAFHTATWTLPATFDSLMLDLISARSETYAHPAALPTVKLGNIKDDLLRRDFTISAMAIRLDGDHFGELTDPLGGQADLEAKLVRVLHPHSFVDDPTRIFRAVRYAGRLRFHLAPETNALIPAALRHVDSLSPERLRNELDVILAEEHPAPMLASLADLGVLAAVKPSLPAFPASRTKWLKHIPPAGSGLEADSSVLPYLLWFIDSDEATAAALADRLYFTASHARILRSTLRLVRHLPEWKTAKPIEWTERLDQVPLIAVYAVHLVHHQPQLKTYLDTWRHIKPTVSGDDLKKLGLAPGPAFKRILSSLRAAWLDGEVKNKMDEDKLLKDLLKQ